MKQETEKTVEGKQPELDNLVAMTVICNIQQLQKAIWGENATYEQYKNNSVEELREMQNELIKEYNQKFKDKN